MPSMVPSTACGKMPCLRSPPAPLSPFFWTCDRKMLRSRRGRQGLGEEPRAPPEELQRPAAEEQADHDLREPEDLHAGAAAQPRRAPNRLGAPMFATDAARGGRGRCQARPRQRAAQTCGRRSGTARRAPPRRDTWGSRRGRR
jgi:hypothetical protein